MRICMRAVHSVLTIAILGASGYSGLELAQLLSRHPHAELRVVSSDKFAGETLGARAAFAVSPALKFVTNRDAVALARDCDVVFLATPAEASLDLVPELADGKRTVIDLSGAFRFAHASTFERTYKLPAATVTGDPNGAVYGLPELFRAQIRGAKTISNPGCFSTAALLALHPLVASGLCEPRGIIVDAASGTTGAGRKASEDFSFSEVEGDFRAYRVLAHQHTPEIHEHLNRSSGKATSLVFTPHLLPTRRGILATSYLRPRPGVTAQALLSALTQAYENEPFVTVLGHPNDVSLRRVVGTNRCVLSACIGSVTGSGTGADGDEAIVVAVSAIDNLVKGAAGQAVQNMNLSFHLDETLGLSDLRGFAP